MCRYISAVVDQANVFFVYPLALLLYYDLQQIVEKKICICDLLAACFLALTLLIVEVHVQFIMSTEINNIGLLFELDIFPTGIREYLGLVMIGTF